MQLNTLCKISNFCKIILSLMMMKLNFKLQHIQKNRNMLDKNIWWFYRENSARGGFGLGLKIVKDICDKNLVIISLNQTIMKQNLHIGLK